MKKTLLITITCLGLSSCSHVMNNNGRAFVSSENYASFEMSYIAKPNTKVDWKDIDQRAVKHCKYGTNSKEIFFEAEQIDAPSEECTKYNMNDKCVETKYTMPYKCLKLNKAPSVK